MFAPLSALPDSRNVSVSVPGRCREPAIPFDNLNGAVEGAAWRRGMPDCKQRRRQLRPWPPCLRARARAHAGRVRVPTGPGHQAQAWATWPWARGPAAVGARSRQPGSGSGRGFRRRRRDVIAATGKRSPFPGQEQFPFPGPEAGSRLGNVTEYPPVRAQSDPPFLAGESLSGFPVPDPKAAPGLGNVAERPRAAGPG